MRIYKNRYYVTRRVRGLSGFQQWGVYDYVVVNGANAQNNRLDVVSEYSRDSFPPGTRFYAQDGHVPGHQPVVSPLAVEEAAREFHMGIRAETP